MGGSEDFPRWILDNSTFLATLSSKLRYDCKPLPLKSLEVDIFIQFVANNEESRKVVVVSHFRISRYDECRSD